MTNEQNEAPVIVPSIEVIPNKVLLERLRFMPPERMKTLIQAGRNEVLDIEWKSTEALEAYEQPLYTYVLILFLKARMAGLDIKSANDVRFLVSQLVTTEAQAFEPAKLSPVESETDAYGF